MIEVNKRDLPTLNRKGANVPLRLNVGVSKKVGMPDYGSLGANCNIEVEIEGCHLFDDPQTFQHKVCLAYAACAQAVEEELARQQAPSRVLSRLPNRCTDARTHFRTGARRIPSQRDQHSNVRRQNTTVATDASPADVQDEAAAQTQLTKAPGSARPERASASRTNGSGVSRRQIEYAQQLASQIPGLGVRRLEKLATDMFGAPITGLTSIDASVLIDTLRAIKEGHLELNAAIEREVT